MSTLQEAAALYDEKEYTRAIPLLEELATAGDTQAMYLLGNIYTNGLGVPADKRQGNAWYYQAAQFGHPEAAKMIAKSMMW